MDLDRERMTLGSMYCISEMNLNIILCSKLNERRVITFIKNVGCTFIDRNNNVVFASIAKRRSDGLSVTKISYHKNK